MSTTPTSWSVVAWVAAATEEVAGVVVEPEPPGVQPPYPSRPPKTMAGWFAAAGAAVAVPVIVVPDPTWTPITAPAAMPNAPIPPISATRLRRPAVAGVGIGLGASAVSLTGPRKAPAVQSRLCAVCELSARAGRGIACPGGGPRTRRPRHLQPGTHPAPQPQRLLPALGLPRRAVRPRRGHPAAAAAGRRAEQRDRPDLPEPLPR